MTELLAVEEKAGLTSAWPYQAFAEDVKRLRDQLRAMILSLQRKGMTLAAYGAAAKAATLLHYCGLGKNELLWVADRNVKKHGLLMGENHLLIRPRKLF